jgi:hypothetical protein
MQPLKLIILSSVTFMQHSTSDNVAMFHVKHPPPPTNPNSLHACFLGREGPLTVMRIWAGGPVDRHA